MFRKMSKLHLVKLVLKVVSNVPYEKIERINLVKEDRSKKQGAEFTSSISDNKTMNE